MNEDKKIIESKIIALIAALLFGASAPFAKVLLNEFKPLQLAGILYLGSGIGLLLIKMIQIKVLNLKNEEAKIERKEIKWLAGAVVFGGIIAPIILMIGLNKTQASTASLLLNFEAVSTTIIAMVFFKEHIGKRLWIAILLITIASIILSLDLSGNWGISLGCIGIILACILWGIDNNFTRNISLKDPFAIVIIKGLVAGSFSIILSIKFGYVFPEIKKIVFGLLLGFFSYGFSLILFIKALRNLGSARTSAFFGFAPFLGTIISIIIFKDKQNVLFYISLPIMITGAYLLLKEEHTHKHIHEEILHEHLHNHNDGHHEHTHEIDEEIENGKHSHKHTHEKKEHSHEHLPDIHHRHQH